MSSIDSALHGRFPVAVAGLLLVLLLSSVCPKLLAAGEDEATGEAWLVTYGPGDIYWQRFGHNAIWIRDPDLGLDHVFNFGFFDFRQQGFLWNFLRGRLLYFSAARPAQREFSDYINANRSIRAQRLNLSQQQALQLVEYLVGEVQPENRDYLYDYYLNNCSTRVRDAVDLALGGILSGKLERIEGVQNFRDHTRRLTASDFWLYLGLEITLGAAVDRTISEWEEFFIPSVMANGFADAELLTGDGVQGLILEDVILYQSTLEAPPDQPLQWWPRYLLSSLAVLALGWFLARFMPGFSALRLAQFWLIVSGLVGVVLIFLWVLTDHLAAGHNFNILLFNPLWWLLAFWNRQAMAGWILLLLSLLALLMPLLPPNQYTLDVIAAVLPLNLAASLILIRASHDPAQRNDAA